MTETPGRARRLDAALTVLVLVLALLPRLSGPSPFLTWDEPVWTWRSLKFLRALQHGRPGDTYLTPHPGVLTMWAGATGIAVRATTERATSGRVTKDRATTAQRAAPEGPPGPAPRAAAGGLRWAWVDDLPAFDEDDTALLSVLVPWWPAARAGIGILTALLVAAAFPLLVVLLGRRTAFVAAWLTAFDPYLLAHGRVLHLDGVLAGLLTVSLLALLVHFRRSGTRWAALAGALAGAAMLEKSPAAFALPFAVLVVAAWAISRFGISRGALRAGARALVPWAVGAAAAYVALWPAMWIDPAGTLGGMWAYATGAASGAREAVFWWGRVQPDPGVWLYLTALPFRLRPLVLVGLAGAVAVLARRRRPEWEWSTAIALVGFAALFVIFMGTSGKKFERYVLPAVPALDIVAAVGLTGIAAAVARRGMRGRDTCAARAGVGAASSTAVAEIAEPNAPTDRTGALIRRRAPRPDVAVAALLSAVLVVQTLAVLRHAPYYLAWYNPLLGGAPVAARLLPVGWGEGMDRVADYLNDLPAGATQTVATPSVALLAPLCAGRTVPLRDWKAADVVVLYVDDVQIGEPDLVRAIHAAWTPEHVVRLNGIDYAWIYRLADNADRPVDGPISAGQAHARQDAAGRADGDRSP